MGWCLGLSWNVVLFWWRFGEFISRSMAPREMAPSQGCGGSDGYVAPSRDVCETGKGARRFPRLDRVVTADRVAWPVGECRAPMHARRFRTGQGS